VRAAVVTVSDGVARGVRDDRSGALLCDALAAAGHEVVLQAVVPDEHGEIAALLARICDADEADLVLTTGGTGFAPRDVTPEAVRPLLTRVMDGFSVVFHQASQTTVGVSTLQSRALAGQIDETFIFCVPGSTGACRDAWDLVLALEFDSRFKPCSLVGQIPRFRGICA
jgi:molybdenum cofactor biosynthesis protein B